jgi:hypothetical protein
MSSSRVEPMTHHLEPHSADHLEDRLRAFMIIKAVSKLLQLLESTDGR